MQRIGMLQAFAELKETEDATFIHPQGNSDQSRLIKMRILSENPANLYIVPIEYDYETGEVTEHKDGDEHIRFLAHIPAGMEQLEFYWRGSFCLRAMGGNIWLDTYDNTSFNVEAADPTSFARLWEREERDPRILEIERAARHNQMLLQEQMKRDFAAHAAAMEAKYASVNPPPTPPVTSETGAGAESTSVSPTGNSETPPPVGSGGEGQSNT